MTSSFLRRLVSTLVAGVVLMLCLRYLFIHFQWQEAFTVLAGARVFQLVGWGAVTVLLYWLLRTLRWYCLLCCHEIHVPFPDLFLITSLSLAFSIVTPFQSGEMMKVEWMKRRGFAGRACGYGIFAVERGMDLAVVIGAAIVSGFADHFGIGSDASMIWLLPVIFFVLAGGKWFLKGKRFEGKTGTFLEAVRTAFKTPWQGMTVLILTVGAWMMTAVGWHVCLISIGMEIGYIRSLILTLWVTLINILSMVPGAVGVSEVSIAELLIFWGYPAPLSQAGALSLRLYSMLILACGAVLFVLNQTRIAFGVLYGNRS
jgi:uncharacterized membrane protein YbhN (UPF0104 family)